MQGDSGIGDTIRNTHHDLKIIRPQKHLDNLSITPDDRHNCKAKPFRAIAHSRQRREPRVDALKEQKGARIFNSR